MRSVRLAAVLPLAALCTLAACSKADPPANALPPAAPAASAPAATTAPERWLGRWTGPEGTFLELSTAPGGYRVTIRNLDGPRTFEGRAAGGAIVFERDGLREAIRATGGAETGMKWLAGKSDCLTVKAGEGYCRD